MNLATAFLVIAVALFGLGAFSRWWAAPVPYYPAFVSGGLFFWSLSALWPQIH